MTLLASSPIHLSPEISGYTIVEQLYLGSRTAVYRAVQTVQQRLVVIKMLRRDYPSFSELLQFRNQYTIAKNLPIPGIVHPLSLELLGSGYALVMEDGGEVSLGKYIQQHPLALTEVLAIGIQLSNILHDLCQHRVVHKDIKPANILIHPESKQVKLIDFSIASLLPKETQEIQSPNILEGTLAYLAPEQTGRMNRGIDYRADFYALGVTLYQLLTGTLPFISDDPLELMHCHMAKIPLPVHQVNPDVPAMVATIVTKLMAKNAEDRYQSALGLKHDLERCLAQWQETGGIAEFEPGQRDLSDRFLIPEKLYGREAEVQTLLAAFDRVARGSSELMLVAGFSGIGKTAVVNEVHKPIVQQRGYFIKGKFDQFNRNIPFSAFVQALRDLMGQLLSESDLQLLQWQTKILAAVGENGQILVDVIPELEQIIGKQLGAPELSGSAAQNRFNLLFQKFIEVFTTAEHPLVLFLDDLQWADLASLQLIKLLMNGNGYLLMLGAYRDNEVSLTHPFILTVEELKKSRAIVHTITLAPLAFDDTNRLIADTLNCSRVIAQPLTELIDHKTKGNPFFTTQFLKVLHEDGRICFDHDRRYWTCDIAQVSALAITDDVVEFMVLQLQKLPLETQQVLKWAACIGNQFDLATLAIVSEQSSADAATALWKVLQEGLILPISQIYKFFQAEELEQADSQSAVNPTYRFLHDRVQQAAYALIPEEQKQRTHLTIGQLLLQNTDETQQDERIFEIVNQLNYGISLIPSLAQRQQYTRLNLKAGRKAKESTAYSAAQHYLAYGMQLLTESGWDIDPDLMRNLYEEAAEVALLNCDFEQMETLIQVVLERTSTLLDQVKVYEVRLQAYQVRNQQLQAITVGREILQKLGVIFPESITPWDIQQLTENTLASLPSCPIAELVNFPVMQEANALAALRIMISLVPSVHQAAPHLFPIIACEEVNLSLKYGNSPFSAPGYADFGIIVSTVLNKLEEGYQFGQLALKIMDRFSERSVQSMVQFKVAAFNQSNRDSIQQAINLLKESYQVGLQMGDSVHSLVSTSFRLMYTYLSGAEDLNSLLKELNIYQEKFATSQHFLNWAHILRYSIKNFTEFGQTPNRLGSDASDEAEYLSILCKENDELALHLFYLSKLILSFSFRDISAAIQDGNEGKRYLKAGMGMPSAPVYYYYDSLTRLTLYPTVDPSQQVELLSQVDENQAKLGIHANAAPINYQHKYFLVEALRCSLLGNSLEAISLYDRAIAEAKANGYIQEEALANELTAQFYLNWGKEKIAQDYLTNAYYGYARWGAKAKTQDLERRYPKLLASILQKPNIAISTNETLFALDSATLQTPDTQTYNSDSSSIAAALNLATILKASQTLSSEIQLDKLLATLLHTVLENAGADKGALLLAREQEWFVEAVATIDQPARVEPIALSSSPEVPHGLIHTVKRSLQPVVIVDATIHPALATDAYVVQQQPKSVLCTPILHQGKLVAILYLENHVIVGAFTSDRIELLNFLCAQAAISLQNARLYQQAQTYAQQLEHSQLQIVQSEKMASLGNLVAGVAHEINNPIGFLNGSINNAKDYVQDLLSYIALYQQHHPNPAAPVQDKAEDIDLDFLIEDLPKLLDSMQGANDRIKSISTSLRIFSRADTQYKVSANLHEGIESTLLILKYRLKANENRPAIQVIQDYGDLPPIECFPGQLNQVFMNILANAIDMFDEMAKNQTFAELEANPQQIIIRTLVDSNQVQIQICDNGKGITEDVKAKVFDHLFTTKGVGKGTGLGLAIARQIVVEKHGGHLEVRSEVCQGTKFCIHLPICGESSQRDHVTMAPSPQNRS
ncbi:serine/threonine protein kinase [Leptolyngbya sp. 'hensonii']|uniref:trifunctional serine/threonine-protein kinase/ATP-binding protein/sensor histidine kinase n=1 Tax=Leptolyngbya sp. 'hensonii' TaxID=1922337 RepID=UPI00094F5B9D|nr:ATP-binding sensor histidine kinase [Leptolyngbya sp. 'hensonii']OLP19944.1 serine/threonine protein kinase [Leptolyngbya sp. 'hensonii']